MILYNGLIRYVFTSTLKLLLTQVGLLVTEFSEGDTFTVTNTGMAKQFCAYAIVVVVTLSYFYFCNLLDQSGDKLQEQSSKRKIGSLYQGLRHESTSIKAYLLIFLARRAIFTAMTFALFSYAGIQISSFCVLNISYMVYIQETRTHKKRMQKRIELFNEWLLCIFTYHLMLLQLCAPLQYSTHTDKIADSTIVTICILLGSNMLILAVKVTLRVMKLMRKRKAQQISRVGLNKPFFG